MCEDNKYFDLNKFGNDYPMNWTWFQKNKPYEFRLNSGDLYILSEKAVGNH